MMSVPRTGLDLIILTIQRIFPGRLVFFRFRSNKFAIADVIYLTQVLNHFS
jgi:hypothetical protein